MNRKLLRRFNGSVRAATSYAQSHGMGLSDLNACYEAADRVVFKGSGTMGGGGNTTYRRPVNLHAETYRNGNATAARMLRS